MTRDQNGRLDSRRGHSALRRAAWSPREVPAPTESPFGGGLAEWPENRVDLVCRANGHGPITLASFVSMKDGTWRVRTRPGRDAYDARGAIDIHCEEPLPNGLRCRRHYAYREDAPATILAFIRDNPSLFEQPDGSRVLVTDDLAEWRRRLGGGSDT